MTNKTWTWIAVVGLFLIGALVGWQLTNVFTPKPPQIKSDTIRIPFDTVAFKKTLKPILITSWKDTGSIKYKDYSILVPFQIPLTAEDTAIILQNYYSTNSGKDTIVNNNEIFFELQHNITQNRLVGYEGRYFWKKPQTIINNSIVIQPTNKLFVGAGIGSNLRDNIGLSGRVTLQNKKDVLYGLEITFIPGQQLIYSAHYDIKIKL